MPALAAPGDAKPTTDALKAAAERMWQEQQGALRTANTYRGKLDEASAYVQRLEGAYTAMLAQNSDLRCKVQIMKEVNEGLAAQIDDQEVGLKVAQDGIAELASDVAFGEHTHPLRPFSEVHTTHFPLSCTCVAAKDREIIAASCAEAQASVQVRAAAAVS